MHDHRLARGTSDNASDEDAALRRLIAHRDRVMAMLRSSRHVPEWAPVPVQYRSRYAASLWALAHGEPEPVSAA